MTSSQDFPTSVIARRLKEVRRARGVSAERLADAMREVGVPFDKAVIANLETGRRRFVTVQELLALAYVLQVAPVHLMVPIDDDNAGYPMVPTSGARTGVVRAWIRGDYALPSSDPRVYFSEVPRDEWTPPGPPSRREEKRRFLYEMEGGDDAGR